MPEILEFDIQRAFTIYYKGERWKKGPNKGQFKVLPAALPGVVAWHTPLGGTRRDAFEGMRLGEIGLEAGIHDYLFLWGGLYGLEFKKPGGALSSSQLAMHPRLLAAGMIASETVDNLPAAIAFVRRHGLVQPGR
jgi:hypothetical protein